MTSIASACIVILYSYSVSTFLGRFLETWGWFTRFSSAYANVSMEKLLKLMKKKWKRKWTCILLKYYFNVSYLSRRHITAFFQSNLNSSNKENFYTPIFPLYLQVFSRLFNSEFHSRFPSCAICLISFFFFFLTSSKS